MPVEIMYRVDLFAIVELVLDNSELLSELFHLIAVFLYISIVLYM